MWIVIESRPKQFWFLFGNLGFATYPDRFANPQRSARNDRSFMKGFSPMQSVVVTGASTGIGWGTVNVLIQHGLRVFGSVRKPADAERLAAEFGEAFVPLVFDITDPAAVQAAAARVRDLQQGQNLFGLVNNAGVAVAGPLQYLTIDDFRRQLEVNLTGTLIVTQAFLPMLGTDLALKGNPGRIINISSVGGKLGAPFLGAYAASKHGLEGLSESLRRELMLYGIDVIIIGPGAVATPIWDKAEALDIAPYAQTDYVAALTRFKKYMIADGRNGLPPEKLGKTIWHALTTRRPKVRYAVVPNPLMNMITMLLPRRVFDRIIARGTGLNRK
jgi:NAD(P)-dependent dehydrogenase (short-subunit alcohol dehydrogenase family)